MSKLVEIGMRLENDKQEHEKIMRDIRLEIASIDSAEGLIDLCIGYFKAPKRLGKRAKDIINKFTEDEGIQNNQKYVPPTIHLASDLERGYYERPPDAKTLAKLRKDAGIDTNSPYWFDDGNDTGLYIDPELITKAELIQFFEYDLDVFDVLERQLILNQDVPKGVNKHHQSLRSLNRSLDLSTRIRRAHDYKFWQKFLFNNDIE